MEHLMEHLMEQRLMIDLFADENSGESGVSESVTEIKPRGALNRGGRPRKAQELAVLAAINYAMPPDKIAEGLTLAYNLAVEHGSPKGILAVLQFVVSYQLGEPVKRVVTQKSTVEELLQQAAGIDDEAFDGLIDAMYDEHNKGQ